MEFKERNDAAQRFRGGTPGPGAREAPHACDASCRSTRAVEDRAGQLGGVRRVVARAWDRGRDAPLAPVLRGAVRLAKPPARLAPGQAERDTVLRHDLPRPHRQDSRRARRFCVPGRCSFGPSVQAGRASRETQSAGVVHVRHVERSRAPLARSHAERWGRGRRAGVTSAHSSFQRIRGKHAPYIVTCSHQAQEERGQRKERRRRDAGHRSRAELPSSGLLARLDSSL